MRGARGAGAIATVLAAAALISAPSRARADNPTLDKAKQQIADLYFEEAIESLRSALEGGRNDIATTAEIHRLWGEVAATLGKTKDAREQFGAYLAIDPHGTLSEGVSPKITKPFASAKEDLGGKAIAISHRLVASDPPTLEVAIASDPLRMVAAIVAEAGDPPRTTRAARGGDADKVQLALARGTARAVIYAIDGHGNRLAAIGSQAEPLAFEATAATSEGGAMTEPVDSADSVPDAEGKQFRSYWILTGGLSIGLLTLGTVAGLSANRNTDEIERRIVDSENIEFGTQIQPLEDKARRDALVANIAFATAGAAAIATVVLYFVVRDEEGPVIAPAVTGDSVGVSAAIAF